MTITARIAVAYTKVAWDVLRPNFRHERFCVGATRATLDALRLLGIHGAFAMPCRVIAANASWLANAAEGLPHLAGRDGQALPHSVGIGFSGTENAHEFDGHLVAVAGDWILDGSIPQVNREERGIIVQRAVALRVTPTNVMPWRKQLPNGGAVLYYPNLTVAPSRWRRGKDWSLPAHVGKELAAAWRQELLTIRTGDTPHA